MRLTMNIYTKYGRKIATAAGDRHMIDQVLNAFKTSASYSMTIREEGGKEVTIPLENIDYIEVT